ncbi:MAG: Asp-tRNA(Asn)/Glu-tRNA(Gln) amidotransferase subunit GatA [Hyphomonas sp.]|nr:Asp-tRNA(Asn)/Glu-tRNA(Gln) amidotransferase subunit GatA [Hyphomonas sp.]MCB9971163.1 Asp-tRNA(Asn)/Glu-tRNA(Gln) amidotransferase subunit GatA [Hyphomonas sp.]
MSESEATKFLTGDVSVQGEVKTYFERIEEKKHLNAYVTLMHDEALQRAKDSDERRKKNKALPLDGLPIAVKDNFCTAGVLTTAGSKILGNFVPTYESFVTQKLLDAGAVFLGKTNMDEFGMGSSTEKSMHGPTINPNVRSDGTQVVPGGSSGGSAAAVAADLAVAAIGTDTGGSLRQPAAFCGVVGFKPSYGHCSRWGVIAYGSSLDQPGTITKSVADAAILLDVMIARDPKDSTSIDYEGPSLQSALNAGSKKFTVGIPEELAGLVSSQYLEYVWDRAKELCGKANIEIKPVSLPHIRYALPAYYIIALSEASSNLARYDGMRYGYSDQGANNLIERYERSRSAGFGEEVRRRILLGTYSLSSGYYDEYYLRATKVRRKIKEDFDAALQHVDAMIWPTAPTTAFAFGLDATDPLTMYLEDVFTVPINLAGVPAASIPIGVYDDGLPVGLQVVGARHRDADVIGIAHKIEKVADYVRPCTIG